MKDAIRRHLRDELLKLMSVQRCVFAQPTITANAVKAADVIVQTWAGIVIYIHLVDEPVKPPKLRRIVEHATNAGISTLFLADLRLLPRPGERVPADRWFVALAALAGNWLYTYRLTPRGPALRPVQFTPVSRLEVEARYAGDMPVAHLRHFRLDVRHSAVKGYWMLADFEPEHAARAHYRRPEAAAAAGQTRPPADDDRPAAPASRLDGCYALLGLAREANRDEVKAAFRRLAFALHPDVSDLPKEEAEARFKALSEAYEQIKAANSWG